MPLGGSQPHLSQRYWGTPAGFFAPHSEQNFPLFTAPQAQTQPSDTCTGFLAPHSGQNFPVAAVPQEGHTQLSAFLGSGFFAPHSGQNLPVTILPQAHLQASAVGAVGAVGAA